MNLYLSFRSELTKISRSKTWLLTFLASAMVPLLMILVFDSNSAEDIKILKGDPWNKYFAQSRIPVSIIFLPLFVLLICTLLPQIECRNNTWKQVLTSPQPVGQIYFSKFLILQFLILTFLLAYLLLMGISGLIVNAIHPVFRFLDYGIDLSKIIIKTFQTYISVLAISAFLFWIGMLSKNFIFPIAIGVIFWFITALLLFEYQWQHINKFPFAFPILIPFPRYQAIVPVLLWSSFCYAIAFLIIGFIHFKNREIKG